MASIDILLDEIIGTINPNLYGHFVEHLGTCVYDGLWRKNELCPDVIAALKKLRPPVIRWPGGCFADDYHWRDGIGPAGSRPKTVNLHWGQTIDDNSFGTHEFMRLCRELGAKPYLSGNVGAGSPRELRDWVEYCNHPAGSALSDLRIQNGEPDPFRVQHWGVGNEPWGCGGHFSPEDYAGEYRRFSTYLRELGGSPLILIAAGPDGNDLAWTRRFFESILQNPRWPVKIEGFAAHYYCGTAGPSATDFGEADWYELLYKAGQIEQLITQQRALMDEFDPQRKISLLIDEWGTWHLPTPGRNPAFLWQQNTLRDALVAAITLDTFNRHADKLAMCNIAQMVNVLQAMVLSENGRCVTTPTFHVFELYQNHQGGRSIRLAVDAPKITFSHDGLMKRLAGLVASASIKGTTLTLTVSNPSLADEVEVAIQLRPAGRAAIVRETVITHADTRAHNTFEEPRAVEPSPPRTLPASGGQFTYTFRPQSITRLEMSIV